MGKAEEFSFTSSDGVRITAYKWAAQKPKAVLQIVHGSVEYAMRYDALARWLCDQGVSVYAEDHLGHGKTAKSDDYVGHISDSKGAFLKIVEDMHTLDKRIREENPGLPVFMLGHSMGSFLTRLYAARYGGSLSGVALTGTGGRNAAYLSLMIALAGAVMVLRGGAHRPRMMGKLYKQEMNGTFKGSTGNEFISSDPAVVEAYTADPRCGNALSAEFFHEMLWGTREAATKRSVSAFPKELPLFIGAGEFDTVGGRELKEVKKDAAAYKNAGVKDVTFKIYPGMRHEVLNEKGKQQVWDDIIGWLDNHITDQ
jgi:alpha-beta hydrolase superfamily lysophospholipase